MYSWHNFKDKLKRYFKFSHKEIKNLVLTIIVLGFVSSFNEWGSTSFALGMGMKNLFNAILILALSMLVRESAHRIAALSIGYRVEYSVWNKGLIASLVFAFFSNGRLAVLIPGFIVVHPIVTHRLGKVPYAMNYNTIGWIAMAGSVANLLLAVIFKALTFLPFNEAIMLKVMSINIWLALFGLLPIPPLDGSKLFFGSRYVYFFALGSIIGCALLLSFTGPILSLLGGLFLGVVLMTLFFVYVDKKW